MNKILHTMFLDESNYMSFQKGYLIIGGFIVPNNKIDALNQKIKDLKYLHGLNGQFEMKSTKISDKTLGLYKQVADLLLDDKDVKFRVLIAKKDKVIKSTYADWYTKLHYTLFDKSPFKFSKIVCDRKGANAEVDLSATAEMAYKEIEYKNSNESGLIQATDILLGALNCGVNKNSSSEVKENFSKYIQSKVDFMKTTSLFSGKDYNIFYWEVR